MLHLFVSDIDECFEEPGSCLSEDNRKCKNTNGSFECICADGYEEDSSGACVGKSTQDSNSYALDLILYCTDIDECLAETDLCEQMCINTPGSYDCSCDDGYTEDGFNCTGMLLL